MDFEKNEENRKKVVARVADFPDTLTSNISATECPIKMKFLVLDSADQALQHIP